MGGDAVLAAAAVQQLGVLYRGQWLVVAAQLLIVGFDGPDLVALATLSEGVNGWDIDDLVPGALAELDAPALTVPAAVEVYARLLAMTTGPGTDHQIVRALARLSNPLGHPGGLVTEALVLEDDLDGPGERGAQCRVWADDFEGAIRALPPLDLPPALAAALTG